MDNKLKIAYVLVGIALVGHSFFSPTYVHKFVVPISIVLLLFSIIGSLRARLALIGFFLFFSFNSFILLSYDFSGIFKDISAIAFFVNFLITIIAFILLFNSINIKETASRFSEETPLKLTATMFLIIIVWNFTIYYYASMSKGFLIVGLIFTILSAFIAISLFIKKDIGLFIAPIVLIVITIERINGLLSKLYGNEFSNIFDILSCCVFPPLATVIVISFIFFLKESTLGIGNVITKKKKKSRILLITAVVLSYTALIFVGPVIVSPVSLKWRYDTGYYKYRFLKMVDDVIYASYLSGYLYAIDKSTGNVKWEYYDSDGGFSPCSVVDGVVYVVRWGRGSSEKDYLYTIDATSGKLKWRYDLGGLEGGIYKRAPTVVDGVIYVGSQDHHLYAIDAVSGKLRWRFRTEYYEITSIPSVENGVVHFITINCLYAIDANNGELKWRYRADSSVNVGHYIISTTVANDVVFICVNTNDIFLYAVDANSGELKWQHKTGWVPYPPTVVNGVIYFGSTNCFMYALDTDSGELIWKYKMKDRVLSSPAVVDEVVYAGSMDKNLYALDANSGKLMWKYLTKGNILSNIIVDDGIIYFGSTDGYIYALEIKK